MARDGLLPIQILRAAAALSVCAAHFNELTQMLAGHPDDPFALYPLAAGVDVFFVISGFVMVYSSEPLFGRPDAAREFLIRRIARIVPLYWVATTIGIWAEEVPFDARTLIKSYLFIPYAAPDGGLRPLFGVGWTLNFEMFFYVLFAGAIMLRREAAVACVAAALLAAVAAGRFLHPTIAAFKFWSDPIVLEFAFGMALALVYRRGLRLPAWLGGTLVVIGAIAIWHGVTHMPPSSDRWISCGVPAAMIFAGAVLQPPMKSPMKALSALGDASYSIYLLHSLFLAAILRLWPLGLNTHPMQDVVIAGFIATVATSLATYRFFEKPMARWVRGLFSPGGAWRPALASIAVLAAGGALLYVFLRMFDMPRASGIRLIAATYGGNCGAKRGNATQALAASCDGRGSCDYVVDVAKLGDPATGCSKDFSAEYACAPNDTAHKALLPGEAGLGGHALLACGDALSEAKAAPKRDVAAQVAATARDQAAPPAAEGIKVLAATYGANCGAHLGNSTSDVQAFCGGKANCAYVVDFHRLGDPAGGCQKNFVAIYQCPGRSDALTSEAPAEAGFGASLQLSCP